MAIAAAVRASMTNAPISPSHGIMSEESAALHAVLEQNASDWKVILKDGELGDRAVIARDKKIGSLKKNILTELSPSDSD